MNNKLARFVICLMLFGFLALGIESLDAHAEESSACICRIDRFQHLFAQLRIPERTAAKLAEHNPLHCAELLEFRRCGIVAIDSLDDVRAVDKFDSPQCAVTDIRRVSFFPSDDIRLFNASEQLLPILAIA